METDRNGHAERSEVPRERGELLARISGWLDLPLSVLALLMLGLLILELAADLSPAWSARVQRTETAIWAVFVAAFILELALAPSKVEYLKKNWLTAVSVALPALRTIRLLRLARALRGLSLVRILTTLNRGSRALGHVARRGQLGYVLALTLLVTATAAAGAFYFEQGEPEAKIRAPGDAIWWAATIVTTINSSLETVTPEGRVIGLMLRMFALAVSGYLTAIIAVYLLGGADRHSSGEAGREELRRLQAEVAGLRELIERRQPEGAVPSDGRGRPPAS